MNNSDYINTNDGGDLNRFEALRGLPNNKAREEIRSGAYRGHTAGIGAGYIQGNVVILPSEYALDFFLFCQRNPKPCPLVGVSNVGDPMMNTLGDDIDIRNDVPLYNMYEDGELTGQMTDISGHWRSDFVAFVLGCSFTFEEALVAEGIRLRHIDKNTTVPMYKTSLQTRAAGPFQGPIVATMRPMLAAEAIRACTITSRYAHAHGDPIHIGDGAQIGITDLGKPDYGDPVQINKNEIPVFWACGVTPQAAIQAAKPSICITHAPGSMLITDIPSWAGPSIHKLY